MCLAFAEFGATVVVASRKEASCHELAKYISSTYGRHATGISCHVGKWDDCERLVERVSKEVGPIDVLVNNAGMSPLYESLSSISEELFDKTIAVNLKGPFRLSTLVGEQMMKRDGGSIINISSIAAVQPRSIEIPYAIAKAGLNNLTVGLATALGPKVRVNAIMAGPFFTDVMKSWDLDEFNKVAKTTIPLARGGQPEEITGAALYLASSASSFTTGAIIKIDGGVAPSPA
jgi:NAD(P)-dependent dehydrogenase (short-subunit alcohol dehydrogenase family)